MARFGAVEVEGLDELRRTLRGLGDDVVNGWASTNTKVASYVGSKSALAVPNTTGRGTGWLASTWRPTGAKTGAQVSFGGAAAPYANAVHWGTGPRPGLRGPHNIAPSLFLTTTAVETEPEWFPWYAEELDKMLAKVRGQ